MKTELERFERWMREDQESLLQVTKEAQQLWGHSITEIDNRIRLAKHWLWKNEGTKKANKKNWKRFLQNFLKPKGGESRREPLSNYDDKKHTGWK